MNVTLELRPTCRIDHPDPAHQMRPIFHSATTQNSSTYARHWSDIPRLRPRSGNTLRTLASLLYYGVCVAVERCGEKVQVQAHFRDLVKELGEVCEEERFAPTLFAVSLHKRQGSMVVCFVE